MKIYSNDKETINTSFWLSANFDDILTLNVEISIAESNDHVSICKNDDQAIHQLF